MSDLLPALLTEDPPTATPADPPDRAPDYEQLALDWDGLERRADLEPGPGSGSGPVRVPPPPPAISALATAPTLPLPPGRRQLRAQERAFQRRRRRRARLVLLVVLVLLVGGAAGGLMLRAHHRRAPVALPVAAPVEQTLLVGLGTGGQGARSTLLYGLTPGSGTTAAAGAALLLPPRTLVDGPGQTIGGSYALAGSGGEFAGAVSDLLGLRVDATWRLTPDGLSALVTALGGVSVDVDEPIQASGLVLAPGPQTLTGPVATAYALYQGGDTEQAQANRTRLVLDGVLAKLATRGAGLPALLDALAAGAVPASASTWPTARLATYLQALATSTVDDDTQQLPVTTLDTGSAQPAVSLDRTAAPAVVGQLFGAAQRVAQGAPGTRVEVVNDSGRPGLATGVRARLTAAGLTFVRAVNDQPFHQYGRSSIVVLDSSAASIARGHRIAAALGLPDAPVLVGSQASSLVDAYAVLDADYH